MRFCMITTFYPPFHFGGDAVFVYRLANALARQGHEVDVIHDFDAWSMLAVDHSVEPYDNHPGVTVHPIRRKSLPRTALLLSHQLGRPVGAQRGEIRSILDERRPDVIHFHNISLAGGPKVLEYGEALKLCTMHEYWFVCPMHVLWRFDREACTTQTCVRCTLAAGRPLQLWRHTALVQRSAAAVDAFLAPSEFAKAALIERGFPAPIRVLPHFLPDTETEPGEGSESHGYFLYVGRLEKLKGIDSLLETFLSWRGAKLIVVGSGNRESALRDLARTAPHIEFRGWIPHQELRELYRGAIAVIVPSLCYETFGLVPLEAFASGAPAIARRIGALEELLESSGGGFLYETEVELIEAMERLINDPMLRKSLGARGHDAFLSEYSESTHLRSYFAMIEELREQR